MKNTIFFGIIGLALLFAACGEDSEPQVIDLRTGQDSLAYAVGILNGQNLKSDLITAINISELKQAIDDRKNNAPLKYDENEQREIFQDFLNLRREEGAAYSQEKIDKLSYAYGINLADNLQQMGTNDLDINILGAAMNKFLSGTNTQMNYEEAQGYFNERLMVISQQQEQKNRAEGEAFLTENGNRPEVITTPSGLQYEILVEGDGPLPVETSTVKVHYHGTLIDGTVFDSSVDRGEPIEFPVTGVIAGWTEALQIMPQGSKWMLYIPANLAYGERGAGGMIGPGATLIFEVELLEVL